MTDGALSVLTFAAYHQLASGERVRDVVLEDGAGHRADPDGVEALREAGFLTVDKERGRLTDKGEEALDRLVEAIRAAA